MHGKRYKRGHGQDLPGETVMQRNAQKMSFRDTKKTRLAGGAPSPDVRDPIRGRVAHVGMHGAPTIYEEKYRGRMGGRGKRV